MTNLFGRGDFKTEPNADSVAVATLRQDHNGKEKREQKETQNVQFGEDKDTSKLNIRAKA